MVSRRMLKMKHFVCALAVLGMTSAANGYIATFDDLPLAVESYWNGSDGSGGFSSGGAHFNSNYDTMYGSWDGFSYSNITDTAAEGMAGQFNAVAGTGQGGSANYGVSYVGWAGPPTITLDAAGVVEGLYVTNNNSAYYSMLKGDLFAKKFGGVTGDGEDWFVLTITGKDAGGAVTDVVEFYLADYRFADNGEDYIVDAWEYVDLSALGAVKSLEFGLSSSDVGAWGMNTPAYFAIDTVVLEPGTIVRAGPYTEGGVNGYIDSNNHWRHANPLGDAGAILNPIFRGWALSCAEYAPSDDEWFGAGVWNDPNKALGPATGDNFDIVSLGDPNRSEIDSGAEPGRIILVFGDPCDAGDTGAIRDVKGYDFVVFENGFVSAYNTGGGSVAGQMLGELGYVEVSSNGRDFVRFASVSLTPGPVGPYGTIEISNVHNLAGKHPNANGLCTGTPFDLRDVAGDPLVMNGTADINDIHYVRIVDIPGSGDFFDEAEGRIDVTKWPIIGVYDHNHPIYDAWVTFGSGGIDVEAVGVLNEQEYAADVDLNGVVDMFDFALFASAWGSRFGQGAWIGRCDVAEPSDLVIDGRDLATFAGQWLRVEKWRILGM